MLYGKKYKKYHVEECANEYGKTTEKRIVQNTENDTSVVSYDFIFTRNDGTFVGTDILRHPFKIIRNELGLKYEVNENDKVFREYKYGGMEYAYSECKDPRPRNR